MQLSLLSAISFSHLLTYSWKETFLYFFFLIFAQSSPELPGAAPLAVPTFGETQEEHYHPEHCWHLPHHQSLADAAGRPSVRAPVPECCPHMENICCTQTRAIPAFLWQPWLLPGSILEHEWWGFRKETWAWGAVKCVVVDTSQGLGEHLQDSHRMFLLLSPQIHTWLSLENKPGTFHWGTCTQS